VRHVAHTTSSRRRDPSVTNPGLDAAPILFYAEANRTEGVAMEETAPIWYILTGDHIRLDGEEFEVLDKSLNSITSTTDKRTNHVSIED
jgi:hypothetical protein